MEAGGRGSLEGGAGEGKRLEAAADFFVNYGVDCHRQAHKSNPRKLVTCELLGGEGTPCTKRRPCWRFATIGEDLDAFTLRAIVTRSQLVDAQSGLGIGSIVWEQIVDEVGADEAAAVLWSVVKYHSYAEGFAEQRRKAERERARRQAQSGARSNRRRRGR